MNQFQSNEDRATEALIAAAFRLTEGSITDEEIEAFMKTTPAATPEDLEVVRRLGPDPMQAIIEGRVPMKSPEATSVEGFVERLKRHTASEAISQSGEMTSATPNPRTASDTARSGHRGPVPEREGKDNMPSVRETVDFIRFRIREFFAGGLARLGEAQSGQDQRTERVLDFPALARFPGLKPKLVVLLHQKGALVHAMFALQLSGTNPVPPSFSLGIRWTRLDTKKATSVTERVLFDAQHLSIEKRVGDVKPREEWTLKLEYTN